MCPLVVNRGELEPVIQKTSTTQVWMGWPAFDVRTCKFEVDRWLKACHLKLRSWVPDKYLKSKEDPRESVERETERVEREIEGVETMMQRQNEENRRVDAVQ